MGRKGLRIELEKFSKKHLTNQKPRDRIAKLNSIARDLNDGSKEIQKNFKKVLDKTGQRWYSIKAVASDGPGERVSEKKNLKKDEKSS